MHVFSVLLLSSFILIGQCAIAFEGYEVSGIAKKCSEDSVSTPPGYSPPSSVSIVSSSFSTTATPGPSNGTNCGAGMHPGCSTSSEMASCLSTLTTTATTTVTAYVTASSNTTTTKLTMATASTISSQHESSSSNTNATTKPSTCGQESTDSMHTHPSLTTSGSVNSLSPTNYSVKPTSTSITVVSSAMKPSFRSTSMAPSSPVSPFTPTSNSANSKNSYWMLRTIVCILGCIYYL